MQCTVTIHFSFLLAEMAEKVHMLHVAEDEITSSNDDSSDSEELDVEVDGVRVPVAPLVDADVPVDELDVSQLTDEQVLQRLAEASKAYGEFHTGYFPLVGVTMDDKVVHRRSVAVLEGKGNMREGSMSETKLYDERVIVFFQEKPVVDGPLM